MSDSTACDMCDATGKVDGKVCPACGGTGRIVLVDGKRFDRACGQKCFRRPRMGEGR